MATTTTTTKKTDTQSTDKITLFTFLDRQGLSRAERYYYENNNIHLQAEKKTSADWEKSIFDTKK